MKTEYQNPWFKVVKNGKFHFIKENGSDNGAVILALVDGKFLFVKVDRPAHEMISVEAPRGYGEPGESSESCAVRELYEETGFLFSSFDGNPPTARFLLSGSTNTFLPQFQKDFQFVFGYHIQSSTFAYPWLLLVVLPTH